MTLWSVFINPVTYVEGDIVNMILSNQDGDITGTKVHDIFPVRQQYRLNQLINGDHVTQNMMKDLLT